MKKRKFLTSFLICGMLWAGCSKDDSPTSSPRNDPPFDTTKPADTDGDGIIDLLDNCPKVSNKNQANLDGDIFGDACDSDDDNDFIDDNVDNCPRLSNSNQSDVDGDGIGDVCDPVDDRPPEPVITWTANSIVRKCGFFSIWYEIIFVVRNAAASDAVKPTFDIRVQTANGIEQFLFDAPGLYQILDCSGANKQWIINEDRLRACDLTFIRVNIRVRSPLVDTWIERITWESVVKRDCQ